MARKKRKRAVSKRRSRARKPTVVRRKKRPTVKAVRRKKRQTVKAVRKRSTRRARSRVKPRVRRHVKRRIHRKRAKPVKRRRPIKKTTSSGLGRARRAQLIEEILGDLDDYMEDEPQLRSAVFAAAIKEPKFRELLSEKVVEEFRD